MDIFDVLTLIGGLCLFLFGMNVMGDSLERFAGSGLKTLLGRLTNNKFLGFLTGLGVTAVIQSSSATTVMVVGFVNSGLMTLSQAIGVIMGANIGTTVTAWLVSMMGINGSGFLAFLKPMSFTPVLALVGIALCMFAKSSKKKDIGTILLGFTTLMFGMDIMSNAVSGLKDVPAFQNLFLKFENPILGVLVGTFVTAVIQSSSASVGILQGLAHATGKISLTAAIPIIMGQNIGTCVTALLSSIGTNKNARRAAVVHLCFNVIGTAICLVAFWGITEAFDISYFSQQANAVNIAVCHTVFNVACTCMLLPMSKLLEKLAYKIVPEGKTEERFEELDERLLVTPAVALDRCQTMVAVMAEGSISSLKDSISLLKKYDASIAETIKENEEKADHYEDILGSYLVKLSGQNITEYESTEISKLLKLIGDFERISDHSVNVLQSIDEMREKEISFSADAAKEMDNLASAVNEILDLSRKAFIENDLDAARQVEPLEQVIDGIILKMHDGHINRLKTGDCSIESGFILNDLTNNLERVSDHCSNIAIRVIDAADNNMNIHESLKTLKNGNPDFDRQFDIYSKKYLLS